MGASSENEISYQSYCQLGGCRNSSLTKVVHRNGNHTYHYIGYGTAHWKQDLPAGPPDTIRKTK
jgi:hypothetical protein